MRQSFEVNTLGPFHGVKYAVKHMCHNQSSIGVIIGTPEYADYTAAKFALNGLIGVAALELGPLGLRVNRICPASVLAENGHAEAHICRTMSSLNAVIEPSHVAALMHFLAADDCLTLTGQEILPDAGDVDRR
jgi:3alpha(or 20beta)-hydroxysteroid dehydrogenase